MPLSAGTRLGPYQIVAPLGAGGMGEVYRAQDTRLDRTVALKVLPLHLAEREDLRQRFQVEARAIARLQHPNICAVFDVGADSGVDYLILEYLEGETLEKRLERGPLPVSEALQLGIQIASGLDAAHRAGITHRDLKPGNVMLTKSGAKLLDFGLAKFDQKAAAASSSTGMATLTKALTVEGAIMGTFHYMAPEQLEGADADARTDIFAFGLLLYEAITGRKAFQGKSQATLISAIMTADPTPLSTLQPMAPPALERVIGRCIAKDPDERWQSTRDLCRELEWIALGGSQIGAQAAAAGTAARKSTSRLPWIVAALAVAAAAVLAWVHFRERPQSLPMVRFSVAIPPKLPFIAGPRLSPDGSKALVWLGNSGSIWNIYVYTLATGEYKLLPATEEATYSCWSPDSRYVASLNSTAGELRKIEVAGGGFSILAKTTSTNSLAWSRGGILYGGGDGNFYLIPAEGGAPRKVLASTDTATFLQWLPDGEHFLFTVASGGGLETRVASIQGGNPKAVLQSTDYALYAPDGRLLFARNGALLAQAFDPAKLALSGSPSTIVASISTANRSSYSVSQNGILTFHAGLGSGEQQLTWFDRTGRKLGEVGGVDFYTNPALSPDGKRLAVGVGDYFAKKRDIWVFDLVRGGSSRLTFDPADDFNPTWSPDGRYIAFGSDRKGKRDLYRKLASGTGDDELLFENATDSKAPDSWSQDGRYIWVTFQVPGKSDNIYLFTVADRKMEKYLATSFAEDKAHLSPDGRWLAYRSNESGHDEIYLQPFPADGERWQVSTAGGTEPQWRNDGKELFFLAGKALTAVDIKAAGKSVEIGIPHKLFDANVPTISVRNRYLATGDGQKFLVVSQEEQLDATGFDVILNWPELLKGK